MAVAMRVAGFHAGKRRGFSAIRSSMRFARAFGPSDVRRMTGS
jgi:hypothetical protein